MGAHWTQMEMDLLRNLYPDAEMDELLKVFNRPTTAIQQKAFQLRLKKSEAWLQRHYPQKGIERSKRQIKPKPPKVMKIRRYEARLLLDPGSSQLSIADLCFLMPTRTPSDIVKMKIELGIE